MGRQEDPMPRRRILLPFSLACLLSPLAGAASKSTFTLEQVLSAPFPSDLTVSPSGGKIAWIANARGVRNIWIAEPPDRKGHPVTSFTDDDGQEISDLAFTADSKSIVFVRGGDANRKGEIPNPGSRADGAEQAVFVVPASGGAPRKLADGRAPAVSPKGDRVAFVQKDQIWWASLPGVEKAAQAFKSRGDATQIRWSPDGSRLAFVSRRGDHSFVGVFDAAARTVRYLDASTDRDAAPAWSPDGKRLAYLRIPASRELQFFRPQREAEPWSIRAADAATGEGREIFRAERGRGSVFRNVVAENQLLWGEGDRIVFPWERDGWTHLYAVPASGGTPALLTPGGFEVEHVAISQDRKQILFSSNQDDIDRRHLWSVPVAGGKPAPLTSGQGIEWSPEVGSDGTIAYLRSDAKAHPAPAMLGPKGAAVDLTLPSVAADFPEAALVVPEAVILTSADGLKIHAQLFRPRDLRAGERRPAAIFFHGGSRRQMLLGWHYNYYYRNAYAFNQYLASRGYVVLSVNYRSGIGYGMEFREALEYGAAGASEFNDVLGAGLYLQSRPDVDPDRIGLWGGSYGGYLTALGLARASDLFAAGVDLHGVHDWNDVIQNFEPTYEPEKRQEIARLAFASSPMASIKNWRAPVLLIHGDDDRNVPFGQSVMLAEALRERGVPFEELIFPDEVHDLLIHAHWLAAYRAAADFFDRKLTAPAAKRK
jgi:dipeptidyl aminopeptidase/acylaminoacyl peptidase